MTRSPRRKDILEADRIPTALPGPLLPFVGSATIVVVDERGGGEEPSATAGPVFVYAPNILQDQADYRTLLRRWFAMLDVGGKLAVEVSHSFLCERELALPSRSRPSRRRLYTPASLLSEIEEALEPNSYRVRLLCDDDEGYDYRSDIPRGSFAILLVLERIEAPAWSLDQGRVDVAPPPDFEFQPARTRREIVTRAPRQRIVILKLDHLGDFIMGVPALTKARETFANADITLVVGSWNAEMARNLGLFETVLAFDAFPRNSSEEKVDLAARVDDFTRTLPGDYDLAIDLRSDHDTRFFLMHVRAGLRVGIGTRAQFPFLDIFLPIDGTRHGFEAASQTIVDHASFTIAPICTRSPYRIAHELHSKKALNPLDPLLVFGPYIRLNPGDYLYEPHLEIVGDERSLLVLDVAVNMERVTHVVGRPDAIPRLRFSIDDPDALVEFRIFRMSGEKVPPFSFFGGRLLHSGSESVLHQSEYLSLLIDLVKMRTDQHGLLREQAEQA